MAFVEANPTTIATHSGGASAVTSANSSSESVTYAGTQAGDAVFATAQLSNGSNVVLSATAFKETPALQSYSEAGYSSFQVNIVASSGAATTTNLSFTGASDPTGKYPYATDIQMVALANGGFVVTETLTNDSSYDGAVNSNLYYEVFSNTGTVTKAWTQVNQAVGSGSTDTSENDFYVLQAEASGGFDIKYETQDEANVYLKRYSSAGALSSTATITQPTINGTVAIEGYNATATDTAGDVMFTFSSQTSNSPDLVQVLNSSNVVVLSNASLGNASSGLPLQAFGVVALATGGFLQLLSTRTNNANGTVTYNAYARTATVNGSTLTYGNLALLSSNSAIQPYAKTTALSNGDVAISLDGAAYQLLRPSALPTNSTTLATLPAIFGTLAPGGSMLATNTAERTATFAGSGTGSATISAQESPIAADHNGGIVAALQTGTTTEYYGVVDANLYVADFAQPLPTLTLTASTAEPVQGGAAVAVLSAQPGVANATGSTGATVTVTNGQSGDKLTVAGVTGSSGTLDGGKITVTGNGTTALTFSGADTLAMYQTILSQVTLQYGATDTDSVSGAHPTRQVSFTLSSGGIQSAATAVTLTLDRLPVVNAVATSVATGSTTTASSTATGVLSVDTDPDGDTLTITGVRTSGGTAGTVGSSLAGSYGALTLKSDGTYSYIANATVTATTGSHPTDVFTDTVSDGKGGTSTSTLTFSLDRAPGTPTDANAVANSVAEGAAAGTTVGLTVQATDPDGDAVSYGITSDSSGGGFAINASTGVVSVANGAKLDYASAAGHSYSVMVQASGTTLSSTQTFAIAVADVAPTISGSSGLQSTSNGTTVSPFSHVVIGEPGSATQLEAVTVKQTELANGNFTAASLAASGFTADANTFGQYDFRGTAAQDTAAIDALVYQPTPVPDGTTLTTHFTIGVGDGTLSASDTSTSVTVPCFVRGTRIRTDQGDVHVEDLTAGDIVVTAAGEHRPVRWIGRRSFAGRFLRSSPQLQPIRFKAGSLGGGLPRRDLLVSPDHAMFIDNLLVAARLLTNGHTIEQERGWGSVDYFHIELDSHDVLLAEGAPSESFLDDDSRGMFHNAHEFDVRRQQARVADGFCAPRVEQGVELEVIRQRLLQEAAATIAA